MYKLFQFWGIMVSHIKWIQFAIKGFIHLPSLDLRRIGLTHTVNIAKMFRTNGITISQFFLFATLICLFCKKPFADKRWLTILFSKYVFIFFYEVLSVTLIIVGTAVGGGSRLPFETTLINPGVAPVSCLKSFDPLFLLCINSSTSLLWILM